MQSWWVHIVPHYRKGKAAGTKPDQRLWGPGQTTKWEEGTLWGSRNALKLGRAGGDAGGWWHGHMHLSEHTDLNTKTAGFYYMWIIIWFYKLKHTWNRKNETQVSMCTPAHTPSPPWLLPKEGSLWVSVEQGQKNGQLCKCINFKP